MKTSKIRIVVEAVRQRPRRALELFQDARFKPRVIPSRRAYSRKNSRVENN